MSNSRKHANWPDRRGSKKPNAKLLRKDIRYIREYAGRSDLCYGWKSFLARQFDVSPGTVADILCRRRWP